VTNWGEFLTALKGGKPNALNPSFMSLYLSPPAVR
jgi:hypothetical protein